MAHYEIVKAFSGKEALQKIEEFHPELVILDVMMPHVNGYEVCEQMKANVFTRHTPVIMLSAKKNVEDRVTGLEIGADDYMVKPFNPVELRVRVESLLRRSTETLDANPITHLPGNVSIEREIIQRIKQHPKFAFCYVDLDHFKAFNDKYGFYQGDQIILLVARILEKSIREKGNPTDFIGHIGGDDFVFITTPDRVKSLSQAIITEFDSRVPEFYDETDRQQGFIISQNRQGLVTRFPIMTLTIVAITNEQREITHPAEISAIEGELKAYAKSLEGSNYVIDKRKEKVINKEYHKFIKILILDTEVRRARLRKLQLEGENYTVALAQTARDAISLLEEQKPSVVLIEKDVPFMDAYELSHYINKNPHLQKTPVMVMSNVMMIEKDPQSDYIDYFTKKIKLDELLDTVRGILE